MNINVMPKTWYEALVMAGIYTLPVVLALPEQEIEKWKLLFIPFGLLLFGIGSWIDHPERHFREVIKEEGGRGIIAGTKKDYEPSFKGSAVSALGLIMLIPAIYKIASQAY